jgi:hypothetical protein
MDNRKLGVLVLSAALILSSLPAFAAEVRTAIKTLSTGETITSEESGSDCQQAKILERCGKEFPPMGSLYFRSCALDIGSIGDAITFAELTAAIDGKEGGAEDYKKFIQEVRAEYPDCFDTGQ